MPDSYERRLRWLVRLTLIGTLFTAVVMLVGAWTRLVDAGLGCPDWPGCYGKLLVPDSDHATLRHPDVPLEPFKAWVEMAHRYIASLLGLAVISVVALGWPLRQRSGYPWRLSLTLLVVIILQGAFGAFTVTLQLWPQVVTLHLLGGLSVLLLFFWLHLRLRRARKKSITEPRRTNACWGIAACLLVVQLALGGWVTSNYAGIACQGFPTCNGQWWPELDVSEGFHVTQTVGPNYLHGQLHADARTAIHVVHRLGALMLGAGLVALWLRYRHWQNVARPLAIVVSLYMLQAILGVANVLLWLPLWLALLHTAGAIALSVGLVWAWWCWRYNEAGAFSKSSNLFYRNVIAD
ncbi:MULTISPECIES: COX15/CtaA family protein [Halomonadaceae]|uniref:COX15/CtaA family protein n=1 Tax=Halomonadaceae TaxID=28256 RepID=UPI0004E3BF66|nr:MULTISPECIES: COX15/CtaA family protein [unclassified Halomonas]AJY50556.1 cytochrome oxidase assembly [Halomonas sp. KO116]